MTRKMLAEEKLLRDSIIEECGGMPLDIKRQITALVRAVREDCAKVQRGDDHHPRRHRQGRGEGRG